MRKSIIVPATVAVSIEKNARICTISYQKMISFLCSKIPFRIAYTVFNMMSGRQKNGNEIPLNTMISDFYEDGMAICLAKEELAIPILKEHQINPDTLKYEGDQWPEEWKQHEDMLMNFEGLQEIQALINPSDIIDNSEFFHAEIIEEESDERKSKDELVEIGKKLYSQPDTREILIRRIRRSSRIEAEVEDFEWIVNGFIKWYNENVTDSSCKILRLWTIEKGSEWTVYISIDAVYVDKQSGNHIKGGKPEMKDKTNKISHWNISVEFDGLRYSITAKTLHGAFQQLFAFLISNDLMNRYFVFFADGETTIFDTVKECFADFDKMRILDWFHITEKLKQRLSSAIVHEMVEDPRSVAKAENTGKKSDIKRCAKSVLYERKLKSILWVGNVAEATSYLRNIDPKDIKNQTAIEKLIDYLNRKKEWITCYAIRRRLGLRNSSNGSEGDNQTIVAKRQKDNLMSWSEMGSYAASNVNIVYINEEDETWYREGKVTFSVPQSRREEAKAKIKKQVHGKMN